MGIGTAIIVADSGANLGEKPLEAIPEVSENKLDELGTRLLAVLEETWELTQSLEELRELKTQNEATLKNKLEEYETAKDDPAAKQKLDEEINELREVMTNNEKIEAEMEGTLRKNMEEKKVIQDTILKFSTETKTNQNLQLYYKQLEQTCNALTKEKSNLETQNREMKKEAITWAKEKEEKDLRIQELERQVEALKRALIEKDRLLAHNQQIIVKLSQKNGLDIEIPNVRNSLNIYNYNNFNGVMDIIPSTARERHNIVIPTEGAYEKDHSSSDSKNKSPGKVEDNKSPSRDISQNKKTSGGHNPNPKGNPRPVETANQQNRNSKYKQSFQPVSIQELKSYAEKLRDVNFDNVPNRNKRKKKTNSKVKKESFLPTPLQNLSNYQNALKAQGKGETAMIENPYKITAAINRENERPSREREKLITSPGNDKAEHKISSSPNKTNPFTDISSIMPPNEHSVDYSVKDLILENLYSSNKEVNSRLENINRAGQPAFHVNLATLVRNMNKNSRFEIQREQDVKKPINQEDTLAKLKNISENQFKFNEKPSTPSNTANNDDPKTKKGESPIGSLRMKYWDLVNENNKFKNEMESIQSQPSISTQATTNNVQNDGGKSPVKRGDVSREKVPVHEIRTLDSARDLIRTFKIKLYSLSYAVDNNLLDDYYTEEIFHLIKEYNQNKYILQNNDISVLKKLENAVFNKLNRNKLSSEPNRSSSIGKNDGNPTEQPKIEVTSYPSSLCEIPGNTQIQNKLPHRAASQTLEEPTQDYPKLQKMLSAYDPQDNFLKVQEPHR